MEINSNFIWNFKNGKNIEFNLNKVLAFKYKVFNDTHYSSYERKLLYKSMVILIASITEAVLQDFYKRIYGATREGVRGLTEDVIDLIRGKEIDKFNTYIVHAQKNDFFDVAHTDFYGALEDLRKYRNRIHIQNEKNHFVPYDYYAFDSSTLKMAERVLEAVLKTMEHKYLRDVTNNLENFKLPWNEHFEGMDFNS